MSFGTVTDIDGNKYQTVQIGSKTWMAENLKVIHYRNGDEIPTGYSDSDWADLNSSQTGAYAIYDDNPSNAEIYGNLYNWYAVDDGRGICPEGWYLPSDDEYKLLEMYLGMSESDADSTYWRGTDEGGKLKEEGLEHWNSPNTGATNESGFTALPGGSRSFNSGGYFNMAGGGYYWTSSGNFSNDAWYRLISYNKSEIARLAISKRSGQSVRCVSYESETGTILVPQEFLTIQEAVDAATDGDTILVSAGTYYEQIEIKGYPNGENQRNIVIIGEDRETTIIDGGNYYPSVVTFDSGVETTSVLSGFTIINGYSVYGGGIHCDNNSSPTLRDLTITNNSSQINGGGIAIRRNSHPTLIDMTISGNWAENSGGGMYILQSDPILEHVIISGNTSDIWGGGIFINELSHPILSHVTISGNSADNYGGGGIKCMDDANPSLINCILWNNSPQEIDFINYTNTDPNSITIAYSDLQGGEDAIITNGLNTVSWMDGNIDIDPLFFDPENGDYNLTATSPCIDTGDPESELDPDGTRADMGAYYFEQESNCIDFHEGTNLISFSTLPRHGPSDMPECIGGIIGEGVGAVFIDGSWIGSLTEFSCEDGYWFMNYCEDFEWCYNGAECSEETEYALHLGNNLISYTLSDCGSIEEVLPDDVEECVYAIAGEGVAALNTDSGWVGSLTALCPNDGYWFVSECEIDFTYDEPTTLARRQVLNPSPYPYNQSSKQAFYFIESIENIKAGDWILSYNGNKLIGTRQWTGSIIDVPAMGSDGYDYSTGYMQSGGTPQFKLLSGGKLINLEGEVPAWSDNGLFMVSSLTEAILLPEVFSLDRAYPNPFNPTTTLSFAIPVDSEISLSVYNLQGREVVSLINGNIDSGYHSVIWNANNHSSGVYFVKMVAGEYISTQKLMLVK